MTPTDQSRAESAAPDGAIPLEARITVKDEGPDELTLAPSQASGDARLTRWVSADAHSVVLLDEMR